MIMTKNIDLMLIAPYAYFSTIPGTTPPGGIAYIASYVRKGGYNVDLLDADVLKIPNERVIEDITNKKPKLIGISVNVFTVKSTIHLIDLIRKRLDTPIILGGPFASSSPEYLLDNSTGTVGVIIGEGEIAVYKILQNLEAGKFIFDNLSNVCYYDNHKLIKFKSFERILDLDSLPFPAWDLFPSLKIYNMRARKSPSIPIVTSRGCPHKCNFCSRTVFGSIMTMRTPKNIVEEVDWAMGEFGAKQFDIMDDNFSADMKRAHEIFDLLLKKRRNISINIQAMRADRMDEELVIKMKKAGVYRIAIGIENGDEQFLKKMNKRLSLDRVIASNSLAKKYGIVTYGYFILGLPGENRQSMQNTIKFAQRLNPTFANFMIAIPLPGSDLYTEVRERGKFLIETNMGLSSTFQSGTVYYEIDDLHEEDVRYCFKKAYSKFYFSPYKILEILLSFRSITEWTWFFKMIYFFTIDKINNRMKN
jgi:anaerobic magnesium-protoporphyrin IX monomethyl ester cyclase